MRISIKEHIVSIMKIVAFFVLFGFLCLLMNYFTLPILTYDTSIIAGFYAEEKNTLDVVYIGGSASFVYYQPLKAFEDYGITSYDFGANTIQAELYTYMIDEVLERQNPKLLILDARAFQYRDKDQPPTEIAYRNVLSGTPLNLNKAKFIEKYVKKVLKEEDTLPYYFNFIKFHSATDIYSKEEGIKMFKNEFSQAYKGFMFIPKINKETFVDYETLEEQAPSDETVEILDELLEYLKDKDFKVLFVVSPYIEQKQHKMVFNYVERRVKEAGFDFIDSNDYRKEMGINYSKDFYHFGHVNIFGSDKYTDFICDYINDNIEYTDHRKESKYDSWNELLPRWNQTKKETIEAIELEMEKMK